MRDTIASASGRRATRRPGLQPTPEGGAEPGGGPYDLRMCEAMPAITGLSTAAAEALEATGRACRLARGEPAIQEGEPAGSLYVVRSGRLKMCRATPGGRNLILSLAGPGEVVGVPGVLSGTPASASWVAMQESEILEVGRSDLLALLGRRPELLAELLGWLGRQLAECRNCLVETSCSRVESRFATLFLDLATKLGRPTAGGLAIPLALTRQELADLTGTTLETAIRVMTRWAREGVVETAPRGFVLHDRERLEALSWA